MLKRIIFIIVLFGVFSLLGISFFSHVQAKDVLLAASSSSAPPSSSTPVGGSGLPLAAPIGDTTQSNLAQYVNTIYNLAIFVGISLTILVIIFAGYKYMSSSGDPQSMAEAKELLWGAIVGLILILITRLILVSIDSRILRFPRYNPLNSTSPNYSASRPLTSAEADLVVQARTTCESKKGSTGSADWDKGPCLDNNYKNSGYALDVVHSPRTDVDDQDSNTCGVISKYIELSTGCNYIRIVD